VGASRQKANAGSHLNKARYDDSGLVLANVSGAEEVVRSPRIGSIQTAEEVLGI
jgi:autotransporter translocation and assembly factor TamB